MRLMEPFPQGDSTHYSKKTAELVSLEAVMHPDHHNCRPQLIGGDVFRDSLLPGMDHVAGTDVLRGDKRYAVLIK